MTDSEVELDVRLRALANEFAALAHDNQARLAFVDRVESVLDEPQLWLQLRAKLHLLAAEALLQCSAGCGVIVRDRLLKHLDSAEALPTEPNVNDFTHVTRVHAFLKFGLADGPAVDSSLAAAQAVQAFDDLIDRPNAEPARVAPLAFNGSKFLVDHLGPPKDEESWDRLQGLLRLAYKQYVSAQLEPQAVDAASRFAAAVAARLERLPPSDQKGQELFHEAWLLVNYAMSNTSSAESAITWARTNEVAATLLSTRPGFSRAYNAREAVDHLDRALLAYQDISDHKAASACATRLIGEMDQIPPPWSVRMVDRLEHYVRLTKNQSEPVVLILIANAWAKVPASELPGRHAKIRTAAEKAFEAASGAGLNVVAAYSKILIGNSLLDEAGFLELNAEKDHLTASDCSLLANACDALERACELAVAGSHSAAEAQATRLLGAVLGRRVTHCDSPHLVDRALSTLRRAVALSAGDERAAAIVNLAGLTLEAVRKGLGSSPRALQDVVDQVRQLLPSSEDPRLHDAYKSLSDALEEYELVGASAEESDRAEPTISPGTPTRTLHFTVHKSEELAIAGGIKSGYRITLRLVLEASDRMQGKMRLERSGPTVSVAFSTPCPSCQTLRNWSMPFIVSFDSDPAAAKCLEDMVNGDVVCPNCGAAVQYQFAFTARSRTFDESFVIVCPDIWASSTGPLGRDQLRLACAVHRSWTKDPIRQLAVPWSGASAMTIVNAETALSNKRDVALRLLVLGVLAPDDTLIKQAFESDPDLWRSSETIDANRLSTILGLAPTAPIRPLPDMSALAQGINELLAFARRSGVGAVVQEIRSLREAQSAQIAAFDDAINLSTDKDKRQTFLHSFLNHTPDYSPERSQSLYETLLLGEELELRAMEERGVPRDDSLRYQFALARIKAARKHTREAIEEDRKVNSSRAAKDLILDSIRGGRRFVLLLRAFSFEVDRRPLSPERKKMTEKDTPPNLAVRLLSFSPGDRKIERIAKATAQDNIIMIVNVLDWSVPRGVEKLFANNREWQKLAFALIPEASAIIFVLPTDRAPSEGVLAEMAAVQRLGAVGKTVIVLSRHKHNNDTNGSMTQPKPEGDVGITDWSTHLRSSGFGIVFAEEEINSNPALLAGAVKSLLDRPVS